METVRPPLCCDGKNRNRACLLIIVSKLRRRLFLLLQERLSNAINWSPLNSMPATCAPLLIFGAYGQLLLRVRPAIGASRSNSLCPRPKVILRPFRFQISPPSILAATFISFAARLRQDR